jgi:methionine-S-sulfoxide reductase
MMRILVSFIGLSILCTAARSADEGRKDSAVADHPLEKATFAGGCFWCMQPPFDKVKGVLSTVVGYTGGTQENPSYEQVSSGRTGHAESIQITYDPAKVSYEQLLDVFWKNIDPTTLNRQFADAGSQYRTAIFYHTEQQRKLAVASKEKLEKSGRFKEPIVTEITPASKFHPAEEYHQSYYKKNSMHYNSYRSASGRDKFLKEVWGSDYQH